MSLDAGGRAVGKPVVFAADVGRMRDVRERPDGPLCVLTESELGQHIRLRP